MKNTEWFLQCEVKWVVEIKFYFSLCECFIFRVLLWTSDVEILNNFLIELSWFVEKLCLWVYKCCCLLDSLPRVLVLRILIRSVNCTDVKLVQQVMSNLNNQVEATGEATEVASNHNHHPWIQGWTMNLAAK